MNSVPALQQGLTRSNIWAFALAAYEPDIERMAALVQDLDDNRVAAAVGRLDGDDAATSGHCWGVMREA